MSLRSPLSRVLYHGAAHDGTGHWWVQRVTAVALAPLAIWLTVSLLALPDGYGAVTAWIGAGMHPVLLALTLGLAIWHSWLGLQVVIEDYVHTRWKEVVLQIATTFACALGALACVFAIMRIVLAPQ